MARFSGLHLLFFSFIIATGTISVVSGTVITIVNSCSFPVWPGLLTGDKGAQLNDGGFELAPGATMDVTPPAGWSGRIWGRTGCNFDASGTGSCLTGDCGNQLRCPVGVGGATPVTLAEFTIGKDGGPDNYDVSLVDGYNIQMALTTRDGTGDCRSGGCDSDLNGSCPNDQRVLDGANNVVACKSACEAFKKPEYCCTGAFDKPETCPPTDLSKMFKAACPRAYSYAYDDKNTSLFTCSNANYSIVFCPRA